MGRDGRPRLAIRASDGRSVVENPEWADAAGLPTAHAVRAALQVASIIDPGGSRVVDARRSYWKHAAGGAMSPSDLRIGERLLIDCALVVERDGALHPTPALPLLLDGTFENAMAYLYGEVLRSVATELIPEKRAIIERAVASAISDPARREELLLQLARRFDDTQQKLIGEVGEHIVVASLREELRSLGHEQLARRVHRLSEISDQIGYDINAPRISGSPRLIEVKATTASDGAVVVHLTRNESDVGERFADWFLVVARVTDVERREGEVVGWCGAVALKSLLPSDTVSSRWEQAQITLALDVLHPGLPQPF